MATKEQELGIREIADAIHELEKATQENSEIAITSAKFGLELNTKAVQIKDIIDALNSIIHCNSYNKSL